MDPPLSTFIITSEIMPINSCKEIPPTFANLFSSLYSHCRKVQFYEKDLATEMHSQQEYSGISAIYYSLEEMKLISYATEQEDSHLNNEPIKIDPLPLLLNPLTEDEDVKLYSGSRSELYIRFVNQLYDYSTNKEFNKVIKACNINLTYYTISKNKVNNEWAISKIKMSSSDPSIELSQVEVLFDEASNIAFILYDMNKYQLLDRVMHQYVFSNDNEKMANYYFRQYINHIINGESMYLQSLKDYIRDYLSKINADQIKNFDFIFSPYDDGVCKVANAFDKLVEKLQQNKSLLKDVSILFETTNKRCSICKNDTSNSVAVMAKKDGNNETYYCLDCQYKSLVRYFANSSVQPGENTEAVTDAKQNILIMLSILKAWRTN